MKTLKTSNITQILKCGDLKANSMILQILSKGKQSDFDAFVQALVEINQGQLAALLQE
jgi:hypothetical protein